MVVLPAPRANREPAFGPRLTTRSPTPAGQVADRDRHLLVPHLARGFDRGRVMVVTAGSPPDGRSSTEPQDEQKFEPSGLRCPQRLQKIDVTPTR